MPGISGPREKEMARKNPNFANWFGPDFEAGREVPCHYCNATGVDPDGEQIDVDEYRADLCGNCRGTGIEPWRPAGCRDTSAPIFDELIVGSLRHARARVIKAKTGYVMGGTLSQHRDTHARYVKRAGRQTVGFAQHMMVEAAIRMDVTCRGAVAAWRDVEAKAVAA